MKNSTSRSIKEGDRETKAGIWATEAAEEEQQHHEWQFIALCCYWEGTAPQLTPAFAFFPNFNFHFVCSLMFHLCFFGWDRETKACGFMLGYAWKMSENPCSLFLLIFAFGFFFLGFRPLKGGGDAWLLYLCSSALLLQFS